MKTKFKIIQSNPNSKGGFVTKIQNARIVETPFGDKEKKETYYVSGPKQMIVDAEIELDMKMFNVVEHEMLNTETGEVFQGKWLHVA